MHTLELLIVDEVIGELFLSRGGEEMDEILLVDLLKERVQTRVVEREKDEMIELTELVGVEV
jgi:hypothetical protein